LRQNDANLLPTLEPYDHDKVDDFNLGPLTYKLHLQSNNLLRCNRLRRIATREEMCCRYMAGRVRYGRWQTWPICSTNVAGCCARRLTLQLK